MYLPLNRYWSKRISLILIIIGVILAPDILVPTPGMDIINFAIAMPLADYLGMSYTAALMLTFMFAFFLIALGLLIFPYNTKRFAYSKLRMGMKFATRHPLLVIASVIILVILWTAGNWFYENLWEYAKNLAIQLGG